MGGSRPVGHCALSLKRYLQTSPSVPSLKSRGFVCVKKGPPERGEEGAYLNRYVTDEQRSRRPIFNATLRAGASWRFFPVRRFARITQLRGPWSRLLKPAHQP